MTAIQIMCCLTFCNAQYVTIPDTKFADWLNAHIPVAMNNNQMDTTNSVVTSLARIEIENDSVFDLTGVQYFSSLITLDCGNGVYAYAPNRLKFLPPLPPTLDTLICGSNLLDSLPYSLPPTLRFLKCYNNPLHQLPVLPNALTYLECYSDSLKNLPALTPALYFLNCGFNSLDSIPTLPGTLQILYCNSDSLYVLPALPNSLVSLDCGNNFLTSLPSLPSSLQGLECSNNALASLPALPSSLYWLACAQNQLANLTALPNLLSELDCGYNPLANLPVLPASLYWLSCEQDQLSILPALPNSLAYLYCENNQLTNLPPLPSSLVDVRCDFNFLTSLPALPNLLIYLSCQNNNIPCFPLFPNSIVWLNIYNNPFNCLPNYIPNMDLTTLSFPLCSPANSNGCPPAEGIVGFTYKDNNGNCTMDAGDGALINIPVQLYDNANNFLAKTFTAINGVYDFPQPAGTYTASVDTVAIPFVMSLCANPGLDSVVTTTLLDTNVNFAVACKPGFDVGVQSATTGCQLIFPGFQHELFISAGDMSKRYNLNCATGVSGQVQISVTGNVNYIGPAPGALIPSVSGNVFTYSISDFSLINNSTDFNLIFQTMTSAQAGDIICASVSVSPTAGDIDTTNNIYSYCYVVENSHDPNEKEVYPKTVPIGYQGWFTYTIRFENTGTAPAMNIHLTDTLDKNLDPSTLQEINYSHTNTAIVNGNVLAVNFPNINLAANATGFVQYRIKPKQTIVGKYIHNMAYIYFDYNEPIVTNDAVSSFHDILPTGTNELKENEIFIFPNPTSEFIYLNYARKNPQAQFEILDLLGRKIQSGMLQTRIDVSLLESGFYMLKITDGDFRFSASFVKE